MERSSTQSSLTKILTDTHVSLTSATRLYWPPNSFSHFALLPPTSSACCEEASSRGSEEFSFILSLSTLHAEEAFETL